MSFHQKIPTLAIASVLVLGLTGCSTFITLKDTPTPAPEMTFAPRPTPYYTPDVPAASPIPKDTYTAPVPEPLETVAATPATTFVAPESEPVPEEAVGIPVPKSYSAQTTQLMSADEEKLIRTNANKALDRMLSISRTPEYRKLLAEVNALPTIGDRGAYKKVLDNNWQVVESINQVYTVTGDYQLHGTGPGESDEFIRDYLVVNSFSQLTNILISQDGYMEVAPGAIVKRGGEYYVKADDSVPAVTVVLRNPTTNAYQYVPGFEGWTLEGDGARFVLEMIDM